MWYQQLLTYLPAEITALLFATALGLFLGLEREWSNKPAGVRTFALTSIIGALFASTNNDLLLAGGLLFAITTTAFLGLKGYQSADTGLFLTTSASMVVAYGVGILAGYNRFLEATAIAVLSSSLLILKRELHNFSSNLSKEELRSATEFAIIAFVVYPLLPTEPLGPWNAINLQLVWLLVIAVSAVGFINYILVKKYNQKGFWVTGFFGGLVNSTAVIVSLANQMTDTDNATAPTVGAILLANGAMAVRNAAIVIAFIPTAAITVGLPLAALTIGGILISFIAGDWSNPIDIDITSPFSLKNALTFGGLFLIILVISAGAQATFGSIGFLATSFLAGLVSSGTATTTAVTLASTNQITTTTAAYGVVAGSIASIIVKVVFAATISRKLIKPVLIWNTLLILIVGGATALIAYL